MTWWKVIVTTDACSCVGAPVFVATDEAERSWFAPLAREYRLLFAADLDNLVLSEELHA